MGKAKYMTDRETCTHHSADDKKSRDDSRASCIDKLLETEFKTERKQQNHDAYLCPELDVVFRTYRRKIFEMRTGKETGDNIAEDNRLFKPFEHQSRYSPENQYECEVTDKSLDIERL